MSKETKLFTTTIKGYILLKSGLHIGGSEAGVHIGGIDNPVIKNPITKMPYIPGSSLKGKMRFLLEHSHGFVKEDDRGRIPKHNVIATIFGHLDHNDNNITYPTRVIFRDAQIVGVIENLSKEEYSEQDINMNLEEIKANMTTLFVEAKTEVAINRLTGTALGGALRTIERVPAGVVFAFEISLRSFLDDEKDKHLGIIKDGMKLIENDALGGSGSRGSGRIKIFGLDIQTKENN